MKSFLSRYGILTLTLAIVAACVYGVVKLSQTVGENLAPVRPRILIFGATYCRYCPSDAEVEKLATEYPWADVQHYQIDVRGEGYDMGKKYHIKRTPTIIVCDGDGCDTFYSLTELRKWLECSVGDSKSGCLILAFVRPDSGDPEYIRTRGYMVKSVPEPWDTEPWKKYDINVVPTFWLGDLRDETTHKFESFNELMEYLEPNGA